MFIDAYLPDKIRGYPFVSSPRWSTAITTVSNGDERRNQNWVHPLHRFTAPECVSCMDDLEDIKAAWYALAGPTHSFPFRDPLDFASRRLSEPNQTPSLLLRTDQYLGSYDPATRSYIRAVPDGIATDFQLMKEYSFGSVTYRRLVYMPVVETVLIGVNGDPPDDAISTPPFGGPFTVEVDRRSGVVSFSAAPGEGAVLTWGGLFDVECRFESDDAFDALTRSFGVTGAADLSFTEIRPC